MGHWELLAAQHRRCQGSATLLSSAAPQEMDTEHFINSNICFSKQHLCKQPWSQHIHREPLASTQSPSRSRDSISCSPGSGGMLDHCPALPVPVPRPRHGTSAPPLPSQGHPWAGQCQHHSPGVVTTTGTTSRERWCLSSALQDSSTPRLCVPVEIPVICQTRTSVLRDTIGVTSPLSGPRQLEPGVNDLYFRKCFKILG